MKTTGICPKCQSASVTRLKAFRNYSTSNMVRLTLWGAHRAYFDRYVCTQCGYLEDYLRLDEKVWQKWLKKQSQQNGLDSDFV